MSYLDELGGGGGGGDHDGYANYYGAAGGEDTFTQSLNPNQQSGAMAGASGRYSSSGAMMSQSLSNSQQNRPAPPTLVSDVRAGVTAMRFAPFLKNFDEEAAAASIAMCSVPTGTVEDAARAQLLTFDIQRESQAMQHKNNLIKIAELRRNRLQELDIKRQEHHNLQIQSLNSIGLIQQQTSDLVHTYYDLAEREMEIHLTSRKAEVQRTIGNVSKWHYNDYDPDKPDWSKFEQEVQIQVCKLRGVKNKIPKGKYVLLVSKWEKMGLDAKPLAWSYRKVTDNPPPVCPIHFESKNIYEKMNCEVCTGIAGSTLPLEHGGKATDYEMPFESKLFTFFPSQNDIKPYNVLVFELARIPPLSEWRDDQPFRPQVVAWGAMPIVDSKFEVINGKFRLPMLRGPYKPHFGHYYTMQDAILDDIENWLCNLYVDIYPHAREYFGRSEFELEREFTRKLLALENYPAAKDSEGWPLEKKLRGNSLKGASLDPLASYKGRTIGEFTGTMGTTFGMFEDEKFPYIRPAQYPEGETEALTRWSIIRQSIINHIREKKNNAIAAQRDAIRRVEQQKKFRYSIHPLGATNLRSVWSIQVDYCLRAILDELNLKKPLSYGFWLNVVVFIISLLFQVYIHGLFVYFTLYLLSIHVEDFYPAWYGFNVVYSHVKTQQVQELAIVIMSMASTYVFLLAEILMGALLWWAMGATPERLSKFIFTTAISAALVPIIEVIIDGASGGDLRRSDWYRLDTFFKQHDYGDYFTPLIWIILYFLLLFGSTVTMFLYTMKLHLNGILQDAFWRIMVVNESTCFLPDDLEISVSELQHILLHAERWRGKGGERRKVIVERLVTTDAQDEDYHREDMHIRIVELDCGHARHWFSSRAQKVHREFFITQDGTVLELMNGDGGGSQGMMGAAVGIGFLLNNLANTMRSKAMDSWKGIFKGIGGAGVGRASNEGSGALGRDLSGGLDEDDFALRAARASYGQTGAGGGGGIMDSAYSPAGGADGFNFGTSAARRRQSSMVSPGKFSSGTGGGEGNYESPFFGRGNDQEMADFAASFSGSFY